MPQTRATANLADVSNTIIREARHTQEYHNPSWQLIEKVTLPKGSDTVRMPKVGQFTIADLQDGVDITAEQSINLSYVDLTATERGAKIILTDKLVRENGTTDLFKIVGKQFGMAGARKQDRDTQALYAGLNGGTAYGAAADVFSLAKFAAAIVNAQGGGASSTDSDGSEPFYPTYAVVHPHQAYQITKSATTIGAGTNMRVNDEREEKMLKNFFAINFNGVRMYESGNIYVDSSGDATGVIAEKDAMVGLTSVGWGTKRDYDISLRATEVVFTSDYGVFELDDAHGAPLLYDAGAPSTST